MDEGVLKIRKTALRNMWGDIHKLRNLIFPLNRYIIYGCPLYHHKQSKLINCNVIPLYLVSFEVILQLKLCLKYFIRNFHGYGYPLQGSEEKSHNRKKGSISLISFIFSVRFKFHKKLINYIVYLRTPEECLERIKKRYKLC